VHAALVPVVIRLIRDHLRPTARVSWSGRDLDFTGTVFDGGDFSGATFSGGTVKFGGARFSGGTVNLSSPEDWSVPPSHLPPSAPGLLLPKGRGGVSDKKASPRLARPCTLLREDRKSVV